MLKVSCRTHQNLLFGASTAVGLLKRLNYFSQELLRRSLSAAPVFSVVVPGLVSERRSVPKDIIKPSYWWSGQPQKSPKSCILKTNEDIIKIKRSCQLASSILHSLEPMIKPGVTTDEIDEYVHNKIVEANCYPSPLNYHNFPKSLCTSVNNVACHGIPDDRPLVDGDIINVDITVFRDGYHGDCSAMFLVGEVDPAGKKLCRVTHEALMAAISICKSGERLCSIGNTIQEIAESNGLTVLPCFVGHGIGTNFHEKPDILHYKNGHDETMTKGMVFTIEPVLSEGTFDAVCILEDGWTAVTEDNARTAQWEHTILIEDDGAIILTLPDKTQVP